MKYLIPAVLFFVFAMANCRLALNKTPKTEIGWGDTCGECQTIIKRIVEVAKDPVKVAELKMLLSALCRETHYQEECRLFVSKIDLFLDRLLPYLKDAHHVCQELRMCSNRRLEQFHRVGLFYARNKLRGTTEAKNSLMCEECKFAAHELRSLVEDPNVQQDVQDFVQENVCAHMGSYKDMCDQYLEEVLPEFFQELDNMLADANKFCEEIDLCPANFASSTPQNEKKLFSTLKNFFQNGPPAAVIQTLNEGTKLNNGKGCLYCEEILKLIHDNLISNSTIERLKIPQRLLRICYLVVPKQIRADCIDFMQRYSMAFYFAAVDVLYGPKTCKQIGFCGNSTQLTMKQQTFKGIKCNSCLALNEILQMELSSQKVQKEFVETIELLCNRMPIGSRPICRNIVESFVPVAITEIIRELQNGKICNAIHACQNA